MTHIENVFMTAQATFGRDGAMFESLLGFVAQLSLVLWGTVLLTVVLRFVGIWIYRRSAARTDSTKAVAPSVTGPASAAETGVIQATAGTGITSEETQQSTETPDAMTASAQVRSPARLDRRADVKPVASVPTFATPSTEA